MFKQNFIRLCNEKGVSPTAACAEIGLSNATFSCWTDESVPRKATLMRIADYFGVAEDVLLSDDLSTPAAKAFSAAADNYERALGEYDAKRRALVGLKAARGTKGSRAVKGMRTVKVGPDLDPNLVALLDRMTADQLADVERYAEFILSKKKSN